MHLAVQVIGIPVLAAMSAAVGSAVVSAIASAALGICDPKFGCSFGLQFGAGLNAIVGFLLGVLLLCLLAGYTAATGRLVPRGTTLLIASLLGLALGIVWAVLATASYV